MDAPLVRVLAGLLVLEEYLKEILAKGGVGVKVQRPKMHVVSNQVIEERTSDTHQAGKITSTVFMFYSTLRISKSGQ